MKTSIKAIHQFHSGSATGDAITNAMLFTQSLLRRFGYKSEIYAEHIGPGLEKKIKPHKSYRTKREQVLMVHHSMGHNLMDWLSALEDQKTLVYHNITPAKHFSDETTQRYIALGRQQLRQLERLAQSIIADSQFNLAELNPQSAQRADVIPLLFDTDRIENAPFNCEIARKRGDCFRVLFVGRMLPHKRQDELIEVLYHLKRLSDFTVELVLVGYNQLPDYSARLENTVRAFGLGNSVRILGDVSEEDLWAWYRASDAFLCLSEHEGFGVPLIEAMLFDLPVFAAARSAIPDTLGGAGVLFDSKTDLKRIAAMLLLTHEDRRFRRKLLDEQRRSAARFKPDQIAQRLAKHFDINALPSEMGGKSSNKKIYSIQFEGPAETSYSLAIVNRNLCHELNRIKGIDLSVYLTEGPGNYEVDEKALAQLPELRKLSSKGTEFAAKDAILRNLFPPRVADMTGKLNALCFAWEESSVPSEWVDRFNERLDYIFAASEFTKRSLIDSGARVPIVVYGHGVDHIAKSSGKYENLPKRAFRFLHISSCFPRKAPDVLIKSFASAFEPEDNVELLIKTFPNPHSTIVSEVENLKTRSGKKPLITIIQEDISPSDISSLYESSDCLAMPSRGEGFGLPLAEALLHKKSIITTQWSGQLDFCNEQNAWFVPFKLRPARSHLAEPNSLWAEPDAKALSSILKKVASTDRTALNTRVNNGYRFVKENLTWGKCANRIASILADHNRDSVAIVSKPRIAWISPWNTHCGIATYSHFLLKQSAFADCETKIFSDISFGPFLSQNDESIRCWSQDFNNPYQENLADQLIKFHPTAVVIQFNFGFFSVSALAHLIDTLYDLGIKVLIDFHSTADVNKPDLKTSLSDIAKNLSKCHRLLVHNIVDLDRLQSFGLLGNTTLFPHGVFNRPMPIRSRKKKNLGLDSNDLVIASFGFLLPHKGVIELVQAFKLLKENVPNSKLLLVNARHPDPLSKVYEEKIDELIANSKLAASIHRFHDFLKEDQIDTLLEAADITVFPYKQTQESASGAVRYALAANSLVLATAIPIFNDLHEAIKTVDSSDPEILSNAILEIQSSPTIFEKQLSKQRAWTKNSSWGNCAKRLRAMLSQ